MGGGPTKADIKKLEDVNSKFDDYGKRFSNTLKPLATCHDNISSGAGEFAEHLAEGNATFLLGWNETLQACSETTGIMAGNIGKFTVDLTAVDIDQSVTVTI